MRTTTYRQIDDTKINIYVYLFFFQYFYFFDFSVAVSRTICDKLFDDNIFNNIVSKYKTIHALDLYHTKVKDYDFKLLTGCHSLSDLIHKL
jgi:hypothetical protein